MKQSKRIAVTGGIGSGKSTLLAYLKRRGYFVVSCDEVSNALWEREDYREGLKALFPACVKEGKIDRRALSELVFSDEAALSALNGYSHPRIMKELFSRMEGKEIAFAEVPLLFEGGYEGLFDAVIAVVRTKEQRIRAASERDGTSEEEVRARILSQIPEEELMKKPCLFLTNNGTVEELENAADAILRSL